jgi:hypothetical protein
VEEAQLDRRLTNRAEGAAFVRAFTRAGGDHRRLRQAHAVTTGRLPLRTSADDPAFDALVAASLPAASWHIASAGRGGRQNAKRTFKCYPIGYFHIDIVQIQTAEGKLQLFVHRSNLEARLRTSGRERTVHTAAAFLKALIEAVPYEITPC